MSAVLSELLGLSKFARQHVVAIIALFARQRAKDHPITRGGIVFTALAILPLFASAEPSSGQTVTQFGLSSSVTLDGATIALIPAPPMAPVFLQDQLEMEEGDLLVFLSIDLSTGWKTYWRLPGRFGLAPTFDWAQSANMEDAQVHFPAPTLFTEADGQSIGYTQPVLWPVVISPDTTSLPMHVVLDLEVGLCEAICIPERVQLTLPVDQGLHDHGPSLTGGSSITPADILALSTALPVADARQVQATQRQTGTISVFLPSAIPNDALYVLEGIDGHHAIGARDHEALSFPWLGDSNPVRLTKVIPGQNVTVFSIDEAAD